MTWHRLIAAGAALAALAIAAGAFGAHGLKKRLDADALAIFETGARYHMYGALAALALGLAAAHGLRTVAPGWVLVAGTAIFAGTLYALALGGPRGHAGGRHAHAGGPGLGGGRRGPRLSAAATRRCRAGERAPRPAVSP